MSEETNNVLFITINDLTEESGNSVATREVVKTFARNDRVRMVLVCPEFSSEGTDDISENVEAVYPIPRQGSLSVGTALKGQAQLVRGLRSALQNHSFDFAVARMHPTLVAPLPFLRRHDLPYVLLARGMSHHSLRFSAVLRRIFWLNARAADAIYAAHQDVKQDADSARRSDQPEARVFPNAVDPDLFPVSSVEASRDGLDLPLNAGDFVVGSVSTFKKYHRISDMVEAVARLNEESDGSIKALVVGDGPQREHIESVAEREGVREETIFTGFVPHEEVHRYISASDVLYGGVDPDSPGNAIKCYEYLACERPIITDRRPEFEFVSEQDVGVLIDLVDEQAIAQALANLYSMDAERRLEMGERGRAYVLDNHTWDALVETILSDASTTLQLSRQVA